MAQTKLKAQQLDNTGQAMLYSNSIINGGCLVIQRTIPNLSTTSQYGSVDRFKVHATGTAVNAGTITQATTASVGASGYALHISGATITGTGIVYVKYRMESMDAKALKNSIASFSCKVRHDVGSAKNFTITIRKATAADNFASVTDIQASSALAVADATATTISLEGVSLGDCSNGIEIEIKIECGAVTTKNFWLTEFQFNPGYRALAFLARPIAAECDACYRYYQKFVIGGFRYYVSNVMRDFRPFPSKMRTSPTFSLAFSGSGLQSNNSAAGAEGYTIDIQYTGGGSGVIDGSATITADAEL